MIFFQRKIWGLYEYVPTQTHIRDTWLSTLFLGRNKTCILISIPLLFQVWFSNRRAKWRREEKLRNQRRGSTGSANSANTTTSAPTIDPPPPTSQSPPPSRLPLNTGSFNPQMYSIPQSAGMDYNPSCLQQAAREHHHHSSYSYMFHDSLHSLQSAYQRAAPAAHSSPHSHTTHHGSSPYGTSNSVNGPPTSTGTGECKIIS